MYPDITHHFTRQHYAILPCDFYAYIFIDHTTRQKTVVIHPDSTTHPASDRLDFILKVLYLEYKLQKDYSTFFLYRPGNDFYREAFYLLFVTYDGDFPSLLRLLPATRPDLEYAIQEPFAPLDTQRMTLLS